jgi:ankyrin repeat protein
MKNLIKTILLATIFNCAAVAQTTNNELFKAVFNNDLSTTESLVKKGANVNYFVIGSPDITVSVLMAAVNNKFYNITKFLLENKADVAWKDNLGNSALCKAAVSGNLEIVKLLVEHGASVLDKDNAGSSVLDKARLSGNNELVLFVENRVKVGVGE